MSAATLVGVAVAYPVNWWLVKNKLKHGMGTERALGKGGAPDASLLQRGAASMGHQHVGMAMPGMGSAAPIADGGPGGHPVPGMAMDGSASVSGLRKALVTGLTLLMLAAGYAVAARYGDLAMRPGDGSMAMPMPSIGRPPGVADTR